MARPTRRRKQPAPAADKRQAILRVDIANRDYLQLIGKRLRARRLTKGLTPSELARDVSARGQKLSDDTVMNYERGISNMKLVTLREMAAVLDIQLTELLDDRTSFDYASGRSQSGERDRTLEVVRKLSQPHLRLVQQYAESLASPTAPSPRKVA